MSDNITLEVKGQLSKDHTPRASKGQKKVLIDSLKGQSVDASSDSLNLEATGDLSKSHKSPSSKGQNGVLNRRLKGRSRTSPSDPTNLNGVVVPPVSKDHQDVTAPKRKKRPLTDSSKDRTLSDASSVPNSVKARRNLLHDHPEDAPSPIIDEIREQWRRRQAWHRAEKSLTLTCKALCRRIVGGDLKTNKERGTELYTAVINDIHHPLVEQAMMAMLPMLAGQKPIIAARKLVEKRLVELAVNLPAASWVESTRGFGLLGFAGIVGEAGNLSNYPKKGHLWKRMGLAVMPDGTRQRRIAGDAAMEHGYSPTRRSLMWVIGDSLLKVQSARVDKETGGVLRAAGPYRVLYDERKAYEIARDPEIRPIVAHLRAKRYVEKRLLKNLWQRWKIGGSILKC